MGWLTIAVGCGLAIGAALTAFALWLIWAAEGSDDEADQIDPALAEWRPPLQEDGPWQT